MCCFSRENFKVHYCTFTTEYKSLKTCEKFAKRFFYTHVIKCLLNIMKSNSTHIYTKSTCTKKYVKTCRFDDRLRDTFKYPQSAIHRILRKIKSIDRSIGESSCRMLPGVNKKDWEHRHIVTALKIAFFCILQEDAVSLVPCERDLRRTTLLYTSPFRGDDTGIRSVIHFSLLSLSVVLFIIPVASRFHLPPLQLFVVFVPHSYDNEPRSASRSCSHRRDVSLFGYANFSLNKENCELRLALI